jgi:hypothetical protein
MKVGLLADIHEQTRQLRSAIAVLPRHGSDRFVVLGDVFETGVTVHGSRVTSVQRCARSSEVFAAWRGRILAPSSSFGGPRSRQRRHGAASRYQRERAGQ